MVAGLLRAEPDWSVAKLLDDLRQERMQHEAMNEVEAAFELSWQRLSGAERQLAMVLGLFALAPVPWELVELVAQQYRVVLPAVPWWKRLWQQPSEPEQWCELIENQVLVQGRRRLTKLSLLNREGEERYQLHGLVRAFLLGKLSAIEAEQALKLTVGFAQAMTAIAKTVQPTVTVKGRGSIVEAVPHLEEVAANRTTVLADEDKTWCCTGLARFYQSLNLWTEAERCHERSLAISKTELGDRHPDTATSLNNLAVLYKSQGRYGEAEPLYVEALEIRKTELGDRHPDTAQGLNNLAELYRSQGRYGEAEPLYVEALEIRKAELGDRHPSTASSLNNLAGLYRSQGRYGEAEPLYVEALEIWKAELGDRHPYTAQV